MGMVSSRMQEGFETHDRTSLQGRNVESFDHVKRDLRIENDDAARAAAEDPATFLKTDGLSEDMKRVMAKLYTPDALKVHIHGPYITLLKLHILMECFSEALRSHQERTTAFQTFGCSSNLGCQRTLNPSWPS